MTDDFDNSCAGKPIKSAMFPFSTDLIRGCEKFSRLCSESSDTKDIRVFNTSCIFSAVSYLEAKINESVSTAKLFLDDGDSEGKIWRVIHDLQKKLSIQEKWDLMASVRNGVLWDASREPFQSFETIVSLRNELVHYKGTFFGRDETPNKRISGLLTKFSIKSESTWVESDCSSWVTDLLNVKELSQWVLEKIKLFDSRYFDLSEGRT